MRGDVLVRRLGRCALRALRGRRGPEVHALCRALLLQGMPAPGLEATPGALREEECRSAPGKAILRHLRSSRKVGETAASLEDPTINT